MKSPFEINKHSLTISYSKQTAERGYTLLELLIVLAIIGILLSIALPQYRNAVRKAREVVLQENLARMRELLDQYKTDKGDNPSSLRQLVVDGYIRKMPVDTITKRSDTWEEIKEDVINIATEFSQLPLGLPADTNINKKPQRLHL